MYQSINQIYIYKVSFIEGPEDAADNQYKDKSVSLDSMKKIT